MVGVITSIICYSFQRPVQIIIIITLIFMIQLVFNQHSGAVVSTVASQQDGVGVILILM